MYSIASLPWWAFTVHVQFAGSWTDDKISGEGTSTYPNGNRFVGQWVNGKINGVGKSSLYGRSNQPYFWIPAICRNSVSLVWRQVSGRLERWEEARKRHILLQVEDDQLFSFLFCNSIIVYLPQIDRGLFDWFEATEQLSSRLSLRNLFIHLFIWPFFILSVTYWHHWRCLNNIDTRYFLVQRWRQIRWRVAQRWKGETGLNTVHTTLTVSNYQCHSSWSDLHAIMA